ncbi:UNVERIFIED_CONTAM: hypothetical protein K2H54_067588 [Gekko kuhli]
MNPTAHLENVWEWAGPDKTGPMSPTLKGGGDPYCYDWTQASVTSPETSSADLSGSESSQELVIVQSHPKTTDQSTMDLTKFGQWLTKHQAQFMQEVVQQQQQSQATLMWDFEQVIIAPGQAMAGGSGNPTWLGNNEILEAFEQATEVAWWPADQRAFTLGSYLAGEAQVAMKALEKMEADEFGKLKAAILDCYGITLEAYCQKFWAMTLSPSG